MDKDYKIKTAVAMYDAGFSMLLIQKEVGDITVVDIRAYREDKQEKRNKYLLTRYNPKKHRHKSAKKPKINKVKQIEWEKRVFAGWKDTPEQATFRRSPEYQQWRINVLERDKYICQHCEQTGGGLVAHHIKTFKMNPELRLDIDNGITLCYKCHRELHLSRVKRPKSLKYTA